MAFYVTGISTQKVHPEFPPRTGTLTEALRAAIKQSATDAVSRDLQQTHALSIAVARKYGLTKLGMWVFGLGLLVGGLNALLSRLL